MKHRDGTLLYMATTKELRVGGKEGAATEPLTMSSHSCIGSYREALLNPPSAWYTLEGRSIQQAHPPEEHILQHPFFSTRT